MATNFLQNTLFKDIILPFLLVFTIVFAILEKTELLGKGKHQINAIIGFVIGAIFISYANLIGKMQDMTAFLVVALFILFIFMLIYSFAHGKSELSTGYRNTITAIAFAAVVVASLVIMDYWDTVYTFFISENGANVLFIAIIIAAIAAVLYSGSEKKKE